MYQTAIRKGDGRWIQSPIFETTTQAEEWLSQQAFVFACNGWTGLVLEPYAIGSAGEA